MTLRCLYESVFVVEQSVVAQLCEQQRTTNAMYGLTFLQYVGQRVTSCDVQMSSRLLFICWT